MQRFSGFVVLELMQVIGIIGILAAVAIPAYSDYLQRAHVSEGLSLAQALKPAITDYYRYHGRFPADNSAAAVAVPQAWQGHSVEKIWIDEGKIKISYQNLSLDGMLILSPQINSAYPLLISHWQCHAEQINTAFLPSACK